MKQRRAVGSRAEAPPKHAEAPSDTYGDSKTPSSKEEKGTHLDSTNQEGKQSRSGGRTSVGTVTTRPI